LTSEKLFKFKLFYIAGLLSSIRASLLLRKITKVKYDGEDWIYKWNGSAAVSSVCYYNPCLNYSDSDLFFFKYKPKNGDIIVDIGVENGSEIPEFCKSVGDNGKVFAIEADPLCYRRLRKLKNILNLNNLILIDCAVGETNKKVRFSQEINELQNRVIVEENFNENYIEINQKTLDKALEAYNLKDLNFVKVNIEGGEINLLKSLNNSSLEIKNWCISCHDFKGIDFRTYDFVYSWLKNSGYKLERFEPQKNNVLWRNYYLYASAIKQS